MNNQAAPRLLFAAATLVLLVATACGTAPAGPVTSALTEAQARDIAENALAALNTGDYAGWSRDWDASMKAAIKEANFLAFRDEILAAYGRYVSIDGIALRPGQQTGNVRWEITAHFEKGDVLFPFVFPQDGNQITGLSPTPIK